MYFKGVFKSNIVIFFSVSDSTVTLEGSIRQSESNKTDKNAQIITSQLIDSFAQTDANLGASSSSSSHDMVDSGLDSQVNITSTTYKERNISVTEEDEPISLTDDRYRYKSVSEEDDNYTTATVCDCDYSTEKNPLFIKVDQPTIDEVNKFGYFPL